MNMDLTNVIVMFFITFFATVIFTWFVRKTLKDADLSDNPIVSENAVQKRGALFVFKTYSG